MTSTRHTAEWALIAVTAAWGLTFPLVKLSLDHTGVSTFLVLRCGLGLLILWPLLRFRLPARSSWRAGLVLGLLQGVAFLTQTAGLQFTTATRSAFITSLSVVFVPMLVAGVLRSRPERWPVVGALVATAGMLVFTNPDSGGLNVGDWLTLACALIYAVYILVLERTTRIHPFEDMLILQAAVLAVIFVPSAIAEGFAMQVSPPLVAGVSSTALILALTLYLLTRFQRDTTATRAAVIYTAEPVFAAGFAFALLGETQGPTEWLGAGIILVGILIALRG